MKKKIAALLIALSSIFLAAGFASCEGCQQTPEAGLGLVTSQEVSVDLSEFNSVVAYGSEFSYEMIKLKYAQVFNGIVLREVVVNGNPDMVVSGGQTDTIGEHKLIIFYEDQEFVIPYSVKYKVEFMAEGEIFHTQYVEKAEDIILPQAPNKAGFKFGGWKTEIPTEITDNFSMEGYYYSAALEIPVLDKLERVYESDGTLADITLPSNENGAWVFVANGDTPIGDVGEHSFDVRFIPTTDELPEIQDVFKVKVSPKQVTFTVENTLFVYDGESHFPKYTASENVQFEVLGQAETNAGVYTFALLVSDRNYEGLYSGSYEIAKPDVRIAVQSASIKYGEQVPEVSYTVEGFTNTEILGIKAQKPNVKAIGEYTLDVTVSITYVIAVVV